jgi:hypothetical protein
MVDSALSPNSALPVEELRRALEWNLLPYQPEQYLERYVRRIDDVYGLMTLPSTNFVVGHLSRIVGDAAASGLRFRT